MGKLIVAVNLPASVRGLVIGRGGETVKRIQRDTRTHIDMRRNDDCARVSGQEPQDVLLCCKEVADQTGGEHACAEI